MSIRSMTGYGTAAAQTEALQAAVTVRSLNHRYLDVSVHVSRRLQALETDIKRVVQERISRGRVELAVQAAFTRDAEGVVVAPRPIVAGLVRALRVKHSLSPPTAVRVFFTGMRCSGDGICTSTVLRGNIWLRLSPTVAVMLTSPHAHFSTRHR